MVLQFRLRRDGEGDWASFVPLIGGWSDERLSIAVADDGPGEPLEATARPTNDHPSNAPGGSGVFALRWFICAAGDAAEFVVLSASAWPEFEAANAGTRIFGLFRAADGGTGSDGNADAANAKVSDGAGSARFLLCTRYPSLAAWESSRADTGSPAFRRRAELTRRTQVTLWRARPLSPGGS